MAGQPEFNQLATIAAMTSKSLAFLSGQSVVSLANGAFERLNIYSPPNTVSKVVIVNSVFDPITEVGAASVKQIYIDMAISPTAGLGVTNCSGNFNVSLQIGSQGYLNQTASSPADVGALAVNIANIRFDDVVGIALVYLNNSTVSTTAKRSYQLFVEREVVKR